MMLMATETVSNNNSNRTRYCNVRIGTLVGIAILLFYFPSVCVGWISSSSLASTPPYQTFQNTICHTGLQPATTIRRNRHQHIFHAKESNDGSDDDDFIDKNSNINRFQQQIPLEKEDDETLERKRMEIVRSLQESFYKTASSSRMNSIVTALEEECSTMNDTDDDISTTSNSDVDEMVNDECKLLDIDSPDSIIDMEELNQITQRSTSRRYDNTTGKIMNLPLWRVQWTEVPYRTNILSVHEAMYTNMFEEILRSPDDQPWYVGHLYLPGGSQSLSSSSSRRPNDDDKISNSLLELQAWKSQQPQNENEHYDYYDSAENQNTDKSAILGTLLRITDYRRLQDGKLLLMVQALHRFVVTDVVQTLPYGIAHVQLLPDREEFTMNQKYHQPMVLQQQPMEHTIQSESLLSMNEMDVFDYRVNAIQESFDHWYEYEFDKTVLPLKSMNYIPLSDVVGASLVKLVPFASFSKKQSTYDKVFMATENRKKINRQQQLPESLPPSMTDRTLESLGATISNADDEPAASTASMTSTIATPCLEQQLLTIGIMQDPFLLQRDTLMRLTLEELEIRLWLTLNDYAKNTRAQIPMVLLELLPRDILWPKQFVLNNIVTVMEKMNTNKSDQQIVYPKKDAANKNNHHFVRVTEQYPSIRRQQRLSYHAAQLLENGEDNESKNILRQQLLQIPTIHGRLAFVSQQFESRENAFG